ncbi:MAG: Rid family hydrolase [Proteobacteria bacterium]|nr:Rid family hydrolase [Pseudomonadota bacterium]
MTIRRIDPDGMYKPNRGIYSQVTVATGNKIVHVAGTVAWDENNTMVGKDDMSAQVQQILKNIDISLKAGGATRADVYRIQAFTPDVDRYIAEGAKHVIEFFGDTKPASTTVEVSRLVVPDWLIEIEATAVIG